MSEDKTWIVYRIEVAPDINGVRRPYLEGPRSPEQVKKKGYGFTADVDAAWPFPNQVQALAKARVVNRHMGFEAQGRHLFGAKLASEETMESGVGV